MAKIEVDGRQLRELAERFRITPERVAAGMVDLMHQMPPVPAEYSPEMAVRKLTGAVGRPRLLHNPA